ncbi:MAG: FHA domain-containing protein [Clostridiales bacterium]|nr:FHA domain-containing protein [Clostridiales bacterium]
MIYIGVSLIGGAAGCLLGLIPYFVGKSRGKPNMGQWGWFWCFLAGFIISSFWVMIGFLIAIMVTQNDARPFRIGSQKNTTEVQHVQVVHQIEPPMSGTLCLNCLSGPLKGRSYNIGRNGMQFGRDVDCAVRFPNDTKGISRHHCAIRWQQGVLVLVDMGSTYGTFQGDGRQLPQNYPVTIAPGSRFYLADPSNLFQITAL